MKNILKNRVATILSIIALSVSFSSVSFANGIECEGSKCEPEEYLTVRFLHAAPYAGPVDVWNERDVLTKAFDFGDVSEYLKSSRNENEVIYLTVSGTDKVVAEFDLSKWEYGLSYTVVVHNVTGSDKRSAYDLKTLISKDPRYAKDSFGTWLAASHIAADVGTVQVRLDDSNPLDRSAWMTLAQGDISEFAKVKTPNTVYIDATFNGLADVVFEIPSLPIDDFVYGFVVSDESGVYLFALLSDNTLAVINPLQEALPDYAEIRIVHLDPKTGPVDIYLDNGLKAVEKLGYAETTGYIKVDSSVSAAAITIHGKDIIDGVVKTPLYLEKNRSYTIAAYNTLKGLGLQITDDLRTYPSPRIDTFLRVSHLIEAVGTVDVYALSSFDGKFSPRGHELLIKNLEYGHPQGYLRLNPGNYTVGLDVNRDGISDAAFRLPLSRTGDILDVYAVIDIDGMPVIFSLFEDGNLYRSYMETVPSSSDQIKDRSVSNSPESRFSTKDELVFQSRPEVIINPPMEYQPIELML